MKVASTSHLGQSIAFALVLAMTSIGVIILMSLASGRL
jgi:hypothetical protein